MGAMKQKAIQQRERKFARRNGDVSGNMADYGSCDASLLRDAIATMARVGGALRFGYTRDGGAYAVGVYGDGDPYTEYVRPSESMDKFLADIIETFA